VSTSEVLKRFDGLSFALDVEIGNFEISVRELLELKPGMVMRTNSASNAALTLRAGGTPFATGEVVVQNDALSVRIKDILPIPARTESPAS
jgi:flagellar motor switch/type III secretory pathway protein FliN